MHKVQKDLIDKIEGKHPYYFDSGQLIINGDCLKIMELLDDNSIDLVLTDPPYGMKFQSNHRKEKHIKIANDNNLDWINELSGKLNILAKEDAHQYIFCSWHFVDIFKQSFSCIKNILVWMKNNTGMGDLYGDYAPQYENILFISNGSKKLNGGRDSNILQFARTQNELHPTEKPVKLFEYLTLKSTKETDLILDCFGGSGTTAVASYKTKRKSIVIEMESSHYKTSCERLKNECDNLMLF